jgi:hypothetical protein
MCSPATDTMTQEKLSDALKQYLKLCGERDKKIAACHMGTRLYHDLGVYGEAAEDYLEVLIKQYHVDLSDFVFDRYFPPEFPGETAISRSLIWFFPYIWKLFRPKEEKEKYLPITLGMIEQALIEKKWAF